IPTGDARTQALAASAAVGAAIGAWASASGTYGPRWASGAALTLTGVVLSSELGAGLAAYGAPAILGVAAGVFAGIVVGQLGSRFPAGPYAHQGLAAAVILAALLAGLAAIVAADRRAPILPLVGWVLAGAGGAAWIDGPAVPPQPGAATAAPVVLVVVSGLRADRVGILGYDRPITPNLDRLGRRSVVFAEAHATSNWSAPSLGSILTGLLPYDHGAGLNDGDGPRGTPLRPDVTTLARALRDGGFATAAAIGDPSLRTWALDTGFDAWRDDPGQGTIPTLLAPLAVAGLDPLRWPRRADADRVTDRALELAGSLGEAGWFLVVQYADASGPLSPTDEDLAAVGHTNRPVPSDSYDAAVRRVDRALGRLLDGLPDNARIAVVGDRGTDLGESRPLATSTRPGARFGASMFEELVHVPLVVTVPGVDPRTIHETVSVVDLAPTLARLAGVPLPTDATPLEPVFGAEIVDRAAIAQSSRFGPEQQMVVAGRYKLVLTADGRSPVYDLEADPAESSPLRQTGTENDGRERHLRSLLRPAGSGSTLRTPPTIAQQLGQIAAGGHR
ncbi:MAG: sulfatase-like hydrolase/transferase, partial [Myxococcota bacterium]